MVNIHKLKGRMAEKGYTQRILAKRLGISDNTMSSRFKLRTAFKTDEIEIICNELGITSSEEKIDIFLPEVSRNRDIMAV